MCGIAGLSVKAPHTASLALLQPFAAALAHRGPDGEGFFVGQGAAATAGLVHRRLSIIDVEGGRQPFEVGRGAGASALVVNGEIYNYKTLQALATQNGATLATQSDCEPLLHRYGQVGPAAFEELQGMYAAALVDGRTGEVTLATDPFGIKPLYYAETNLGIAFASEPKALLGAGWIRPDVNPDALGGLLNRHYSVGAGTLFKGISRLLPGERIVIRAGEIISRSRKLPPLGAENPDASGTDFEAQFTAAVARHLQADVPFGLLLSGGLDSSSVAIAMRALGAPLHAYTAVIDVPGGPNEAEVAAALAKKLGATHTTVPYGEDDFWPGLVDMAWAMDDMVTDYASLPLLKLTKRAREDVKILLSGEGGDELLAGYGSYRKAMRKQGVVRRMQGWLKARRDGDATPHAHIFRQPGLVRVPATPVWGGDMAGFSRLQRWQVQDVAGWLPHDLLLKLDRTTMANGIEGRVPFLDDTFAAWAFSLPDSAKVQDDFGKVVLRQHLDKQGFADMAWARKQGFSVQVGAFLNAKKDRVAKLWQQSPLLQELLQPQAAHGLLGGLGHAKTANLALSLTVLALWHRIHVEQVNRDEVKELFLQS
jgi:asparagine synthase (glutamine-hydrolysing)